MIWLSWRQFRPQALTAAILLVLIAIALAATGPHLSDLYKSAGLTTCHTGCGQLASNFINSIQRSVDEKIFYGGILVLYATPALIGIFWGAPLVSRELEAGTLRLIWNQSVPRRRWLAIKLAFVGLAAVTAAGLVSLMVTWWASPLDAALRLDGSDSPSKLTRLSPLVFGARGVVPLGYAAFAFVLGVTAGLLIRRTVPAMAVTLAIFAALQILMPMVVRPHLLAPATATAPFNVNDAEIMVTSNGSGPPTFTVQGSVAVPGAWILSNRTVLPSGRALPSTVPGVCLQQSPQGCNNWLAARQLRAAVTYQPASRFWPLQWLELGIYLILTSAVGAVCLGQIRRQRA